MKRASKLVVLLVVAALVLGLAGMAGAASFSDVAAENPAFNAVSRLTGLGILNGYPDGSFKPDGNITRAEFAKVAIVAAGQEAAADLLKGSASKFSDVKVNEWYTGWINLAASQGYLKGYPDGAFKPNDNITNAEVITVLMRVLGYNDNLAGDWPVDYIAKAAALGVTSGIAMDASSPASRGDVSRLTSGTLDEEWVTYSKDDDAFTEKGESLVEKNYKGDAVEDALVLGWDYASGNYRIQVFTGAFDPDTNAALTASKTFADTFTLAGASHVSGLENTYVDYILNDDDEIAFAEVKNYGTVSDTEADVSTAGKSDYAEAILKADGKKVTNDDVNYTLDTNVVVNGKKLALDMIDTDDDDVDDTTVDTALQAKKISLVKNKDGDIGLVKTSNSGMPAIVKSYNATSKRITAVNGTGNASLNDANADLSDEETKYIVFKSGKEVTLDVIKPGDTVSVSTDSNGYDYKITVGGKTATGALESVEYKGGEISRVKIAGTKYDIASTGIAYRAKVSTDGGENYTTNLVGNATKLTDAMGKEISVYLSGNGDVEYVSTSGLTASNAFYALVNAKNLNYKGGPDDDTLASIKVLKGDGSKATYNVDGDSRIITSEGSIDGDKNEAQVAVLKGQLAKITLRADGAIDRFELVDDNPPAEGADNVTDFNKDAKTIQVTDEGWLSVTSSTLIFSDASDDQKVSNWDDIKGFLDTDDVASAIVKLDSNKVVAIAFDEALVSEASYGIVTENAEDTDGMYLRINNKGTVTRYDADDVADDAEGASYKSLVTYQASGTDLTEVAKEDLDNATYTVEEVDAANNAIRIVGGVGDTAVDAWFYTDDDTVIYNVTNSPAYLTLADVFAGDKINAPDDLTIENDMVETGNILNFLVIKN